MCGRHRASRHQRPQASLIGSSRFKCLKRVFLPLPSPTPEGTPLHNPPSQRPHTPVTALFIPQLQNPPHGPCSPPFPPLPPHLHVYHSTICPAIAVTHHEQVGITQGRVLQISARTGRAKRGCSTGLLFTSRCHNASWPGWRCSVCQDRGEGGDRMLYFHICVAKATVEKCV